jgi:hypothetical protein
MRALNPAMSLACLEQRAQLAVTARRGCNELIHFFDGFFDGLRSNGLLISQAIDQDRRLIEIVVASSIVRFGLLMTGEEILACEQAGISVTLPKPMTSGAKSKGRFGKQDFVYLADENVYRCPAGEKLKYRFTAEEHGQKLHRYWTDACQTCPIKARWTTGRERRIKRWEHEEVVEVVQERLDKNPNAMRTRRETVEHPFGTLKMRMGATHFLTKTLPKVATEMAICVLTYNLTRVMNIVGIKPLVAAMQA